MHWAVAVTLKITILSCDIVKTFWSLCYYVLIYQSSVLICFCSLLLLEPSWALQDHPGELVVFSFDEAMVKSHG